MLKKILALFLAVFAAVAMAAGAAVDVNKATDAQLDAVKGIGPTTSKAIVAERKKGDFKDWPDLISRVKGIGDKKAAALSKEGLTVNGEPFKAASASAKKDDMKKDETKKAGAPGAPGAAASAKK
jgi:competence protein ComEA